MMNFTKKTLIGLLFTSLVATSALASEKVKHHSGPSSNVAWDITLIRFVAKGDAQRGQALNKKMMCAVCHGDKGISAGRNWPSLAGQQPHYTYKMLKDYHDSKRVDTESSSIMVALSQKLSPQDMADLSQYYASFPLPPASKPQLATPEQVASIMPLLDKGDGKRMIPPCLSCHGVHAQGGLQDMPALAGQSASYFRKTMEEYKSGQRHNDIYSRMRVISEALTDEEINALAQYFAEMGEQPKH